MSTIARALVLALATTLTAATPAAPQGFGLSEVGVRTGLRLDPDQVIGGVHAVFVDSGTLRLVGLAEMGFGGSFTILTASPELHLIAREPSGVAFYFGGGPDIANAWVERGDETVEDTDIGVALLSGIQAPLGASASALVELRIHIHDFEDWFEVDAGLAFPIGR